MENAKKNEAWEKTGDITYEIAGLFQNPPPPPSEPGLDDHDRMRITGLEPARRRHQNLNLARLPIPPYPPVSMSAQQQALHITDIHKLDYIYSYRFCQYTSAACGIVILCNIHDLSSSPICRIMLRLIFTRK